MQVSLKSIGDWARTKRYLHRLHNKDYLLDVLEACGEAGVEALSAATPKITGTTAASWGYLVEVGRKSTKITWTNDNLGDGWFPVAISLQYGHGTGTGGYVEGIDYINPAIRPVFDNIEDTVAKVVRNL